MAGKAICFKENLRRIGVLWRTYLLEKNGLNLHLDPAPEPSHFQYLQVLQILAAWELEKGCLEWTLQDLKVLLWQLWRSTLKKRGLSCYKSQGLEIPTVPIAHWNSKVHALKPTHFTGPAVKMTSPFNRLWSSSGAPASCCWRPISSLTNSK